MEWRVWITWWIKFCVRYSRLFCLSPKKANNTSIRIYVNKIENRITFKIKTAYYLKLLMLEKNEVTLNH